MARDDTVGGHDPVDRGGPTAREDGGDGEAVVRLGEVGAGDVDRVGGKAAALGVLSRIEGVAVPDGFCVTTAAFRRCVGPLPADVDAARAAVAAATIPPALTAAIGREVDRLGPSTPLAVRSSATGEDRPGASAAGQHDSFLGVVGVPALLDAVRRCWASLLTERAVSYRAVTDPSSRGDGSEVGRGDVAMAVVVQRLVPATAAGVLFTADPLSGDRTVVRIEAVAGLGDALVAGEVTPEEWSVRDGRAVPTSGAQVLPPEEVLALAALGRRIEATFGCPQDVEWCRADDGLHVVQSRPITTLFPVPEVDDGRRHVYVSVGHQQMMTDPMTTLGRSVFRETAGAAMVEAGSRLFVDVTDRLANPATRDAVVAGLGRSDPLIGDALRTLVEREGFLPAPPDGAPVPPPMPGTAPAPTPEPDLVPRLIADAEAAWTDLAVRARTTTGPERVALIRDDLAARRERLAGGEHLRPVLAGMEAVWWLDEHLEEWLGERGRAASLIEAAPGDVTAAMGLELLDVADAIRPYPEVVDYLAGIDPDAPRAAFLDGLSDGDGDGPRRGVRATGPRGATGSGGPAGGSEVRAAIEGWLARHGVRGPGEVDVGRPRWREHPASLVPTLLGHVRDLPPGEHERRTADGRAQAEAARGEVLARVAAGPDGEARAAEVAAAIDRARTFIGFREHPKYALVQHYAVYRDVALDAGAELVERGALRSADDVVHLTLDELEDAVRTCVVDLDLIDRRRRETLDDARLRPPRVLTSDGEAVAASYRRDDVPSGALVGLAVSAGVVEGRARVVGDPARAALEPGDVLVTAHTDPSWTPLFVTAAALVTEVGGSMTHGAVVAREYGLPAVVGVEGATRRIPDGAPIRVDGTAGWVELL